MPFISACVSINHRDTSAPGSRAHLSQSKCVSGPSEASAGACERQAGLELPLPPRGSHPLCSSTSGPQSLTSQLTSVSRQYSDCEPACCMLRSPRPALRQRHVHHRHAGRASSGAPFSLGSPSSGPGGSWGLGAACSLSPLSEGARRTCLPWASSGWWGGGALPGAPGAQPPLPCLLLALLTPHPRDVCGASASGGHGCCFPDICRLRFQAAFPPGSPFRFLHLCLPCQAWRGSAGVVSSGAGLCRRPVPGVVDAAPPAHELPLSTSAWSQPFSGRLVSGHCPASPWRREAGPALARGPGGLGQPRP